MADAVIFFGLWVLVICFIIIRSAKSLRNRPGAPSHPTTINKPPKKTVASDGHTIPHSKDITCEGQYGHDHGDMPGRYIVHEEPTEGYCILNGKKVALRDCWKY